MFKIDFIVWKLFCHYNYNHTNNNSLKQTLQYGNFKQDIPEIDEWIMFKIDFIVWKRNEICPFIFRHCLV